MDQASKLRDQVAKTKTRRKTKVISVTSGKGGVGKTQVVANLALALRERGLEVLVLDGDMGLANIDIIFNVSPPYNLKHLLDGTKTIDEILFTGPEGIKILPAASGVQEMTHLSGDNKMSLVQQMDELEGRFDVVLIDTGAGIADSVMTLNAAAHAVFVVVTPEPTSITDAYALIKVMSQKYGQKTFYVVANQVRNEAEGKHIYQSLLNAADRFLDEVQLWHLYSFPQDDKVRISITRQQPIIRFDKDGVMAKAYKDFAKKVTELEVDQKTGGMQFFVHQAVQR